jgi:hypothetical protein
MTTYYMCQITGKYFEDTLIAKTAVRVADYPSESSWGIYKTYDGAAILFDCDVDHAKGELNDDS